MTSSLADPSTFPRVSEDQELRSQALSTAVEIGLPAVSVSLLVASVAGPLWAQVSWAGQLPVFLGLASRDLALLLGSLTLAWPFAAWLGFQARQLERLDPRRAQALAAGGSLAIAATGVLASVSLAGPGLIEAALAATLAATGLVGSKAFGALARGRGRREARVPLAYHLSASAGISAIFLLMGEALLSDLSFSLPLLEGIRIGLFAALPKIWALAVYAAGFSLALTPLAWVLSEVLGAMSARREVPGEKTRARKMSQAGVLLVLFGPLASSLREAFGGWLSSGAVAEPLAMASVLGLVFLFQVGVLRGFSLASRDPEWARLPDLGEPSGLNSGKARSGRFD